jgi:magnesium-transporting ATPase (P-type)
LEVARKVDVVVFDKTGTLTEGVMLVQEATISTAAGAVLGRSFADIVTPDHIIASAQAIESLNNILLHFLLLDTHLHRALLNLQFQTLHDQLMP